MTHAPSPAIHRSSAVLEIGISRLLFQPYAAQRLCCVPRPRQVTEFLDESTLALLLGMMVIVGKLKDTGVFEVICAMTLRWCRGKMWLLAVIMMYITGK